MNQKMTMFSGGWVIPLDIRTFKLTKSKVLGTESKNASGALCWCKAHTYILWAELQSLRILSLGLHLSWAFTRAFHNSIRLVSSMKGKVIWHVNSKDWADCLTCFAAKWFGDNLYRLSRLYIRHTINPCMMMLAETLKAGKAYNICLSSWVQGVPPYNGRDHQCNHPASEYSQLGLPIPLGDDAFLGAQHQSWFLTGWTFFNASQINPG